MVNLWKKFIFQILNQLSNFRLSWFKNLFLIFGAYFYGKNHLAHGAFIPKHSFLPYLEIFFGDIFIKNVSRETFFSHKQP